MTGQTEENHLFSTIWLILLLKRKSMIKFIVNLSHRFSNKSDQSLCRQSLSNGLAWFQTLGMSIETSYLMHKHTIPWCIYIKYDIAVIRIFEIAPNLVCFGYPAFIDSQRNYISYTLMPLIITNMRRTNWINLTFMNILWYLTYSHLFRHWCLFELFVILAAWITKRYINL